MPKILKVKDKVDKYHIKHPIFDLPMKLLINGKSQLSGKSTVLLSILLNPEFGYDKIFKGENIYIVSENDLDQKLKMLQEYKEIPDVNIMKYNENELEDLYEELEERFMEELEDESVEQRLIIFEDCGYSGNLKNKQAGIISKLVNNGRHLCLSQIYISQRITMLNSQIRNGITGAILFSTSMKELAILEEDFNYLNSRRAFVELFRKYTAEPRSFLVINFTNKDGIYMDTDFKTIKM
jgi:hypothetical protein